MVGASPSDPTAEGVRDMSATTGPIVAATSVVVANAVLIQNKPIETQYRVIVGGAIVAMGLTMAERAVPRGAVMFAWLILTTVMFVRIDKTTKAPVESFVDWINGK